MGVVVMLAVVWFCQRTTAIVQGGGHAVLAEQLWQPAGVGDGVVLEVVGIRCSVRANGSGTLAACRQVVGLVGHEFTVRRAAAPP